MSISFWTFALYIGSSVYTSSQQHVIEIFGISHVEGALGVALYVLVCFPSQVCLFPKLTTREGLRSRRALVFTPQRSPSHRSQPRLCHLRLPIRHPMHPHLPGEQLPGSHGPPFPPRLHGRPLPCPCWRLLQGHLGPCAVLLLHRILGHVRYRRSSHGPYNDFVCC